MKYLLKNTKTNVIEMVFDLPVTPSPPLTVIEIDEDQFEQNMLNSIFVSANNYKQYPAWGKEEDWWESDGTQWVDSRDDEKVWDMVREQRNKELTVTDWTQLPDTPLHDETRAAWTEYRKRLRNIPNTYNDPREAERALNTTIERKPRT